MRSGSQKILNIFINSLSAVWVLFFLFVGCIHLGLKDRPTPPPQIDVQRSYFPNGNLEYEAEFINEKLDGTSRVWSEEGTLLSVSEYTNDLPNGVWKTFYPNGSLMKNVQYEFGQKHGYEKWFYETGQLKSEHKFNYGEAVTEIIRWNPDGTILY